jgi:hypothetical protein
VCFVLPSWCARARVFADRIEYEETAEARAMEAALW